MGKKLSEMSFEELWQLFPIFLTEHKAEWKAWYMEEENFLRKCLPAEEERRLSFNKGYTEKGGAEKVFHLHLRRAGDNDEIYFRDYTARQINLPYSII